MSALGQFLVRVSCSCGASRHIEPEALARLAGWSTTLAALAPRLRCSQCGKKAAEVVAPIRTNAGPSANHREWLDASLGEWPGNVVRQGG